MRLSRKNKLLICVRRDRASIQSAPWYEGTHIVRRTDGRHLYLERKDLGLIVDQASSVSEALAKCGVWSTVAQVMGS